jgi:hypothetical protein
MILGFSLLSLITLVTILPNLLIVLFYQLPQSISSRTQPQELARVGMQSIPPRFPSENVPSPEGQGTSGSLVSTLLEDRHTFVWE